MRLLLCGMVCSILFNINSSHAQLNDSLRSKYTNFTIYKFGSHFIKGSDKLTFKDLRTEFSNSELGTISYLQARKFRAFSNVFKVASIITTFTAIGIASNNEIRNKKGFIILVGGQLAFGLGSARFAHLSIQNLDKALWLRNRDLLYPESQINDFHK